MKHSKILKRDDGSRVKIEVELKREYHCQNFSWSYEVYKCANGKRTWVSPRPAYSYSRKTQEEIVSEAYEESLRRASPSEIYEVMTELWSKLKPESI